MRGYQPKGGRKPGKPPPGESGLRREPRVDFFAAPVGGGAVVPLRDAGEVRVRLPDGSELRLMVVAGELWIQPVGGSGFRLTVRAKP